MMKNDDREVLFLGRPYRIGRSDDGTVFLDLETIFFPPRFFRNFPKYFSTWARSRSRKVLALRLAGWSQKLGMKSAGFSLSNARTRWGSCNGRGHLNFNWRLILCPPMVLDYVVVHELIHLRHFNHSRAFWQAVAESYPKFADARRWLKENGGEIMALYRDPAPTF